MEGHMHPLHTIQVPSQIRGPGAEGGVETTPGSSKLVNSLSEHPGFLLRVLLQNDLSRNCFLVYMLRTSHPAHLEADMFQISDIFRLFE